MLLLISQKINLAESVLKTWSEKTTKGCEKSRCVHIPCYSSQEGYVCAQSYATLCNPLNCSPPGFSIHGIFQARTLEWVAISYSRRSSQPGIKPTSLVSPTLEGGFFTIMPPGKPQHPLYVESKKK